MTMAMRMELPTTPTTPALDSWIRMWEAMPRVQVLSARLQVRNINGTKGFCTYIISEVSTEREWWTYVEKERFECREIRICRRQFRTKLERRPRSLALPLERSPRSRPTRRVLPTTHQYPSLLEIHLPTDLILMAREDIRRNQPRSHTHHTSLKVAPSLLERTPRIPHLTLRIHSLFPLPLFPLLSSPLSSVHVILHFLYVLGGESECPPSVCSCMSPLGTSRTSPVRI